MADHFHNFHTKIQILANLNENVVNSHFPEEHGHAAHCRRRRRQNGPTATSEIDTTTPEAGPSSKEGAERGPPTICPRLPLELLELILRHLSKAELFHVLQANKALHSVAVRLLYRDLAIASSDSEESTPAQAILSFLMGLLANNSVHKHVRKLDINLATIQCPTANFYRLLHRLLRGTTGLVVLGLDLPKSQSPVWILEGCTFKLRQFSTSMHCTPELARFLDSQDNIGHLTLRGFQHDALRSLPFIYSGVPSPHSEEASPSDQFTLKETSLPRLTCFNAIHAGPGVVREVVRGRPVATASIPLFSLNSLNALDALETSATPLRRLSVISFDPDAPTFIFEQVAKRFPELEALHIVVLLAEFTNEQLLGACRHLRAFKRLKYITCVATSSEESPAAVEQEIAEKWHQECRTLRTIILPRGRVWFQRPTRVCQRTISKGEGDENAAERSGEVQGRWECLED